MSNHPNWTDTETILYLVTATWDEDDLKEAAAKLLGEGPDAENVATIGWSEIQRLRAQWDASQPPVEIETLMSRALARLMQRGVFKGTSQ